MPERTATDAYGRLRTMGLWRSVGHVLRKRHSTWLTGGLAQRIAQSRYCGQRNRTYKTYRTYKTGALGAVYAMRSENSGAHGCQRAKDLSVKSVFVRSCPFYPAPTLCIAQSAKSVPCHTDFTPFPGDVAAIDQYTLHAGGEDQIKPDHRHMGFETEYQYQQSRDHQCPAAENIDQHHCPGIAGTPQKSAVNQFETVGKIP